MEKQEAKNEALIGGSELNDRLAATCKIDKMVDNFLAWKLPKDFAPDCGIKFTPIDHPNSWPIGTNLLTATQARAMIEHLISGG